MEKKERPTSTENGLWSSAGSITPSPRGTIAFCEREFKAGAKTEGHREQAQKRQQKAEGHRVYYLNMLVGQKEVCPGNIKAVLIKFLSQPLS